MIFYLYFIFETTKKGNLWQKKKVKMKNRRPEPVPY